MASAAIDLALSARADRVGPLLLAAIEDQWFDRKSARVKPRPLGDALVGFANADGGVLVVGLSEGKVEGTDALGRRRNDLVQAPLDFCVPPVHAPARLIECLASDGRTDHLLVFDVQPSAGGVHANARDEVFLRVGDENRRLSFAFRQELAFDRGQGSYEARTVDGADLDGFDQALLAEYVRITGARSAESLLAARGLATEGRITVAGCLLFGQHPQAWLPEAFVRVLRYRGRDRESGVRQQLTSDDVFEGSIPQILTAARARVVEVTPARRALGRAGRFQDVPLVPEDAWLEGLVNAVVHRSYSLAGDHIRVEVFDDRIEITSPGRFPGLVDLSHPACAPRFARNPRIARACADLGYGQELGEGVRRIYDEMRLAGLQAPAYTQTAASVRLVLSGAPGDQALDARLAPDARTISVALRDAGTLGTGEIAELIGRSRPYALQVLNALERSGAIRWVGKSKKDPNAYWELASR